jgi:hypothetical protein
MNGINFFRVFLRDKTLIYENFVALDDNAVVAGKYANYQLTAATQQPVYDIQYPSGIRLGHDNSRRPWS